MSLALVSQALEQTRKNLFMNTSFNVLPSNRNISQFQNTKIPGPNSQVLKTYENEGPHDSKSFFLFQKAHSSRFSHLSPHHNDPLILKKAEDGKAVSITFGYEGPTNRVVLGNTEKCIRLLKGQSVHFQGGLIAGTKILGVKYKINGIEREAIGDADQNFSFGELGHISFQKKLNSALDATGKFGFFEMKGKLIPPHELTDLELEARSDYAGIIVTHKLKLKVEPVKGNGLNGEKEIKIDDTLSLPDIFLEKNSPEFYISAHATGPDHMKVQWYYQLPDNNNWIKIEDGPLQSPDLPHNSLKFEGSTTNTLWVKRHPDHLGGVDGFKFKAIFTDEKKHVSQSTFVNTVQLSNYNEKAITPIGYPVTNGIVNTKKKLRLSGKDPIHFYRSEPNPGSLKNICSKVTRSIVDKDDREPILNGKFPYRAVGLIAGFNKNIPAFGTAFLVSKDTIITAAHCVYDSKTKKFLKNFRFFALLPEGGNLNKAQYSSDIKEIWIDKNYLKDGHPTSDIAVIKLKKPLGKELGWFGYTWKPGANAYNTSNIQIAGYPFDKQDDEGGFSLWLSKGKILQGTHYGLLTDANVTQGNSGGPCFLKDTAAGVLSHTSPIILNVCNRITRPIAYFISKVINIKT